MDEVRKDSSSKVENKMEEVMLPGFRFHPTDEELVGFYLKRKIQHRPLSIELIKQLDIYKYDPWDLPKMATTTTGEKEWYFYCPRDRKYRNSARPNRVTGAGFWKATGTDRPIYSSSSSSHDHHNHSNKCIGLKKSLVFYKGRAAKGIKTDWMMHEFRLPSSSTTIDSSISAATSNNNNKRSYMDKHIPIPSNDAWAICRIFKKANSTVQRALSHSWVSPIMSLHHHHDDQTSHHHHDMQNHEHFHHHHVPNITTTTKAAAAASSSVIQFGDSSSSEVIQQQSSSSIATTSFSPILLDPTSTSSSFSPIMMMSGIDRDHHHSHDHDQLTHSHHHDVLTSKCHGRDHNDEHDHDIQLLNTMTCPIFPIDTTTKTNIDASSLLLNMSSSVFGDMGKSCNKDLDYAVHHDHDHVSISQGQCGNFLMALAEQDMMIRRNYFAAALAVQDDHHHHHHHDNHHDVEQKDHKGQYWESMQSLVVMNMGDQDQDHDHDHGDAWKSNLLLWDSSSSSPCPSDISTTYSTNNKCYT